MPNTFSKTTRPVKSRKGNQPGQIRKPVAVPLVATAEVMENKKQF